MSATAGVEAVEPDVKPAAVVENVNDHTPGPEPVPVVEKVPDPPNENDGLAQLREMVETLAGAVETLTGLVEGQHKDESPGRVPWTHRGGKPAGDDE